LKGACLHDETIWLIDGNNILYKRLWVPHKEKDDRKKRSQKKEYILSLSDDFIEKKGQ